MYRFHHLVQRMGAGHRQHLGMRLAHHIALGAEAAGYNHLAVFRQRFADRLKRFLHCSVDKTAGIDHHHIRIVIAAHDAIAFGAQLGENPFGINRRLRAAE